MFLKNAKPVDITFLQQEQIQHSKMCELKKENAISAFKLFDIFQVPVLLPNSFALT